MAPVAIDRNRLLTVLRATIAVIRTDRFTFLAASIAFYAFLSLFPLLLLVLSVGSIVGGEAFARTVVDSVANLLTPEARDLLTDALLADTGRGSAGLVGIVFLTWAALKVFRGLDIAFDMIYDTPSDRDLLVRLTSAAAVLGAIGVGLGVIFFVRLSLQLLRVPPIWQHLSIVPLFVGLLIVFFPMFAVFPRVHHGPRGAVPGTLVAAAGWALLGEVFAIYAANVGTLALFGLIGGVLLFLTWLYFGAILILIGATVNAVLAGQSLGAVTQSDDEAA